MSRPAPFTAGWELVASHPERLEARLELNQAAFFAGHYPGAPILPGMYLVEALFQAASAHLVSIGRGPHRLGELESCRFRAPMTPGDSLRATLELEAHPGGGVRVRAAASTARGETASVVLVLVSEAPEGPACAMEPDEPAAAGKRLDPAFVRRVLPHRPPALLLDSAVYLAGDGAVGPRLAARKAISANEPCYAPFGEEPPSSWRYPETLIAESFCQSCGLLRASAVSPGSEPSSSGQIPVIARLSGWVFLGQVEPGDCLEHRVELVGTPLGGALFSGTSVANGRLVARVERVTAAMAPREDRVRGQ